MEQRRSSSALERDHRSCIIRCGIGLVLAFLLCIQLRGCELLTQKAVIESVAAATATPKRVIDLGNGDKVVVNPQDEYFNFTTDMPNCNPTVVRSNLFVPIFITARDRVDSLRTTVDSYDRTFASPYELVILDHNSTYPPMVEYLQSLQRDRNITVHSLHEIEWKNVVKEADSIIREYLDNHPLVQYYVVTDPDIALEGTASDILLYYAAMLAACPRVRLVGPMLKISNIPSHYKRKYGPHTLQEWEARFWQKVPSTTTWKGLDYHVAENTIDTTFAMRRRWQRFFRMQCPTCIRTYAPYAAIHLDWYHNSSNLPADKRYYMAHVQKGVNNW